MSYHAGMFGSAPHVRCNHPDCTNVFEAKEARGGGPPAWLRKNTAPPGWRLERDGIERRDYCPAHKEQR